MRACTGTTANGSCYERHKLASSWMSARDSCENDGGWLVTIRSLDEASVLSTMMTYADVVYVGASDFDTGKFTWLDGTLPSESDWFPYQPDFQKDEHCGVTRDAPLAFGLEDHVCNDLLDYICERPIL
jgi:hypothetical protein